MRDVPGSGACGRRAAMLAPGMRGVWAAFTAICIRDSLRSASEIAVNRGECRAVVESAAAAAMYPQADEEAKDSPALEVGRGQFHHWP